MEVTTVSFFSAAAGDVWPFIVAHVHDLGSKSLLLCYVMIAEPSVIIQVLLSETLTIKYFKPAPSSFCRRGFASAKRTEWQKFK